MARRPRFDCKILTGEAPELKQTCEAVAPDQGVGFVQLMLQALKSEKLGVGLAAPQIGVLKRVIVVWPGRHGKPWVMINPEMVSNSDVLDSGEEGCLSFPGVRVRVNRYTRIMLRYQTLSRSQTFEREFTGWTARIIQHELDHLGGICEVGDEWRRQQAALETEAAVKGGVG